MKKLIPRSFLLIFSFSIPGLLFFSVIAFQACNKADESNNLPSCNITSPSDGDIYASGDIVTISATATDSDGNIDRVQFYIDGLSKTSVSTPPYKFEWNTGSESIGNHMLKATSFDNNGGSASDELEIELVNKESADFIASLTIGDAPLTVEFTDQSTNNPTSWQWDFGDGNSSSEQSPSHTYNEMGQYDVTLTATSNSASSTETKANFITVRGTFTDSRDNQTYSIIEIGEQTWFAENLNYEVPDSWCYDNDPANGDVYGRLYPWSEVQTACPGGWHTATDEEWKTLEMHLGMSQADADGTETRGTDEGKKLKSTSAWPPEDIGTDEVGFNAIPAGIYNPTGNFHYMGSYTSWWTLNEYASNVSWYRFVEDDNDRVGRHTYQKTYGFSIRCIKN